MADFYGVKKLNTTFDWKFVVGEDKWKPGRSAYELSYLWNRSGGLPTSLKQLFASSTDERFHDLTPKYGLVEMPVFLDVPKAPSRTDIMAYYGQPSGGTVVVAVEGKATEPFDQPVSKWVRYGTMGPTPTRSRRLRFLSELLGISISPDAQFGYQLVHRTASVVSEVLLHGSSAGAVVVQCFSPKCSKAWGDFQAFTKLLGTEVFKKAKLFGPALLGPKKDVPVFFGWLQEKTRAELLGSN